jgi:hypothetical protein
VERERGDKAAAGGSVRSSVDLHGVNGNVGLPGRPDAAVASDAEGNLHAVWQGSNGGSSGISFAYRSVGGSWDRNVKVNRAAGIGAHGSWQPALAVDASGSSVYVVWVETWPGHVAIVSAYRPAGGEWRDPAVLSDSTEYILADPSVAVDPRTGDVYAGWARYRGCTEAAGSLGVIEARIRPAGGKWGAAITVAAYGSRNGPARATPAAPEDQSVCIAWDEETASGFERYAACRPAGSGDFGSRRLALRAS